ncbi:Serine/threonine-protein kinase-like protein CCR4 [Thalictrum thalictroides]|uniref:non-specific serine/threonine protein kinase n=1 Tax=Thalictrum thalictroides TaxID=46969 RepID=A0A7J6X3M4_THATH|nr:Serine/threonine-protein kinase-like protein CCR4 [Thalictrum thalictroides]
MLEELVAGNSHICGRVSRSNRLQFWQWPEFNTSIAQNLSGIAVGGEFICGLSEIGAIECFGDASIVRNRPTGNFRLVGAGFRHACGIYLDGRISCWGDGVGDIPVGVFTSLALGNNRSCAIRSNGSVVCWGENDFKLPENLVGIQFLSIKGNGRIFCGVVASNFNLFCFGSETINSDSTVFIRALPGPCQANCTCGTLPNSGSYCNNNEAICQSCELAVPPCASPPALPPPPSPPPSNGIHRTRIAFLVIGSVGSSAFVIILCFFLFQFCKTRRCRVHDSGRLDAVGAAPENESSRRQSTRRPTTPEKRLSHMFSLGNGGQLEEFPLQVLLQATKNFSQDYKIGYGSFGSVYRATLDDGREVAIKRAEFTSSLYGIGTKRQDDKENAFISELAHLSRVNHKNLVRLYGFCEDVNELVLVYEFMSNGTLHDHLHKLENTPLKSWTARLKVALDAARGIEYLHTYILPSIIHRDIKSSNILLDSEWTAKVSDFGLSLMGPADNESHLSLRAAGTVGYMDPEYYRLQQLTTKSDVYSFGVVLLELLSGYKAIHPHENGAPRNVVDFIVPFIISDELHHVLDPTLPPPTPYEIEAVTYIGYLAADCVSLEGRDRPSMTETVNSLERALAACGSQQNLSRSDSGSSM